MPVEPEKKRAVVFFDGQNLFYAVKEAFGYKYPNYDVIALAEWACGQNNWELEEIRFYTGIPDPEDNPYWHTFWSRKLSVMGKQGVIIFTRPLRYRNQTVILPDGSQKTVLVGQEKGVDVRLALDVVKVTRENRCDVIVIFSQDQDLSEAAEEIRIIARQQQRWIKIASAFPVSPTYDNRRGIEKTDWIRIPRQVYDKCIDRRDYRQES
ncbi:MAG: NYN domain-containing protein [candidate division WOR-3 bacterium]